MPPSAAHLAAANTATGTGAADVDFSAFIDDAFFQDEAPPHSSSLQLQLEATPDLPLPLRTKPSSQSGFRHGSVDPSVTTSTSSTSSGDSPGVPDSFSPLPQAESALTSASTSPPFASAGFPPPSQSMDKLPDELEQLAASWQSQHQALQHSPLAINTSLAPAMPPYFHPVSSSFPSQLPPEWIAAANSTPSSLPSAGFPAFPSQFAPGSLPASRAMPTAPLLAMNHLGQMVPTPSMDPNLYALHMSLEAQASLAAPTSISAPGTPSGFDLQNAMGGSSGPSTPAAGSSLVRSTTGASGRPSSKRSSSYMKAAIGLGTTGMSTSKAAGTVHQRAKTQPSLHNSPLASPSLAPPHSPSFTDSSSSTSYGFPTAPSYQRPLPPLPKRQPTASASSSTFSNPPSAIVSPILSPSATLSPSANPTPPLSRAQSPRPSFPPVDYDFSSLEQDLDRFTSSGGFASAAAAAMASVGPSTRRGHKGVDAYGVGGYGGSPTPKLAHEALPSPKIVDAVLGENLFFGLGGMKSSPTASSSAASPASSAALPPAVSALLPSSNVDPSNKGSPADSVSPAGSTIIDEESAELLSKKDPIAAQVWRMFHKAKNTMPNGARMENLTWRLMSMTLRKRREESATSAGESEVVNAPSPGTEDARLRKAMEDAIEEQSEERAVKEEGRDVVQPLGGKMGPPGRGRAGGRERSDSSDQMGTTEGEDEERGRGRRTKSGNVSKSAIASTSREVEDGDTMDWRAMSKSRSRSRAPDMMDWRAQSRSRSRAPDFRVSVAPPTIDSTPAMANFSRFSGDTGIPPSSNAMPPPTAPSSSQPASSASNTSPSAAPLSIPQEDNSAALVELATSLGLSPQDQAQLFGSATPRFDGHSLMELPAPRNGISSPLVGPSNTDSPLGLSPHTHSFAFPNGSGGPDPNLAAIESTLNQLISLQNLATSPTASTSSPKGQNALDHAAFVAAKSPSSTFAPSPLSNSTELSPQQSSQRSRQASASGSTSGTGSRASQAQKQLQQFMSGQKASHGALAGASSSAARRASTSSSPYINATTLAQSSRPFSFGAAANVAAAAATSGAPASGLSLARPLHIPPDVSQPSPPAAYSDSPTPLFFPSSAPVQPQFGSPNPPLFGESTDTAQLLYDYFHAQQNPSAYSPYVSQHQDFGSLPAPTHVDPSQLLNTLQQSGSVAASPYGSDASSWGVSPRSQVDSPLADDDLKLPTPPAMKTGRSRLASSSAVTRSSSTSTLANLSTSSGASGSKAKSAPASRAHSRSNTISLPPSIQEGRPLQLVNDSSAGDGVASGSGQADQKEDDKKDGVTRCLNCSTTNTPLWRRDAEGRPLCNACGLFRNLHGVDRPANLNTGVIKKRNRTRGPKDPNSKKSASRGGRRNSASAVSPPAASGSAAARKERAGAGAPYPNAAARAAGQASPQD
ncbi:hypothetical protein JCM1841_002242 [Sporobolomyces salmonicolor]